MNKPSKPENVSAALWGRRLADTVGPLLALVVVVILFAALDANFAGGQFTTFRNLRTVTIQTCTVAVAALGITVIIIAGGIDLSCGTAIALSATVLAWGLREDVAFLIRHGDNFASASQKLQDSQLQAAQSPNDERIKNEAALRRTKLLAVIDAKLKSAPERTALETKRAAVENGRTPLRVDPSWLDGVPNSPYSAAVAALFGVLTGVVCGLINGTLISSLRVVPFIVTLGTMTIYLGVGNWLSGNTPIRPSVKYQVPGWISGIVSNLDQHLILGFPYGVWLAVVVSLLLAAILRYTVFGRYVFALGSNEQTARLCGIDVPWYKAAVYTLGGLFVGLAGVYQFSRLSVGNPMSGNGLELRVIAAVVIGGGSLSGGRGSVLGTLAGAGIMAVIYSGCTQLGMSNAMQDIILGVVIIGAVTVDQLRQRMQ